MDQEFFTVDDMAALLGMKKERLYEAIKLKELRAFRVGKSVKFGQYRIKRTDANSWLKALATRPARDDEEEEILRVG